MGLEKASPLTNIRLIFMMTLGLVVSLILKIKVTFFLDIRISFFVENLLNSETVLHAQLSRVEDQFRLFLGVGQMLSKQSLVDLGS